MIFAKDDLQIPAMKPETYLMSFFSNREMHPYPKVNTFTGLFYTEETYIFWGHPKKPEIAHSKALQYLLSNP